MEALICAIFLDSRGRSGTNEVFRVVQGLFQDGVRRVHVSLRRVDFKTELQEIIQKRFKDIVRYDILDEMGPDHQKEFVVAAMFQGRELGRGRGRSKKQAEQDAAEQAMKMLAFPEREKGGRP